MSLIDILDFRIWDNLRKTQNTSRFIMSNDEFILPFFRGIVRFYLIIHFCIPETSINQIVFDCICTLLSFCWV